MWNPLYAALKHDKCAQCHTYKECNMEFIMYPAARYGSLAAELCPAAWCDTKKPNGNGNFLEYNVAYIGSCYETNCTVWTEGRVMILKNATFQWRSNSPTSAAFISGRPPRVFTLKKKKERSRSAIFNSVTSLPTKYLQVHKPAHSGPACSSARPGLRL